MSGLHAALERKRRGPTPAWTDMTAGVEVCRKG
jgi:hypothetical protein